MASNCAQVQTSHGRRPPTTLREKKLILIEKQMKERRKKVMKVGDQSPG
jgi:hypothetical protein